MASYKLDLINTQLVLSGNDPVDVEDDGSDEWIVASAGYESGLKYLLGGHDWGFATTHATLNRTGDSADPSYTDVYAKPVNCLGLTWIKVDGVAVDWKIIGNSVHLNAAGGTVTAKYVLAPDDTSKIPLLFSASLECLVKAACYEGLNEDPGEARALRSEAEAKLALARTRSDRENAPRRVFKSHMLARRRGAVTRAE